MMFFLEPDQVGDQNRVAALNVLRATSVKVAVLLDKLERVRGPVFALCFDNIEMADDQYGFEP